MICLVGDSNAVYLSRYIIGSVNTDMCKRGWTFENVMSAIRKKSNILHAAHAVVLFTGMNDVTSAAGLVDNVMGILSRLVQGRSGDSVPIYVVPPFCVTDKDGNGVTSMCEARKEASKRLKKLVPHEFANCEWIAPHLSPRTFTVKPAMTLSLSLHKLDSLHLNDNAYRILATPLNERLKSTSTHAKRPIRVTTRASMTRHKPRRSRSVGRRRRSR